MMRIVLIGPPGIGKGTQAERMEKELGIKPLSSGQLLRQEINAGSSLGLQAKEFINRGDLVPDEIIIKMIQSSLKNPEISSQKIALDGFVRTVAQAEKLDEILDQLNTPLYMALALVAKDDILIERLSERLVCKECGAIFHRKYNPPEEKGVCNKCKGELFQRTDDQPEAIRQRLKVYDEVTKPVLEYYKKTDRLRIINGNLTPEEVYQQIQQLFST